MTRAGRVRARASLCRLRRPRLFQVPEEVQADAVSAGDVVGQSGRVRNLVPVQEQLGAQGKPGRHARVVRESAGERQPGRGGVVPVIAIVVIDPADADPGVEAEPVAGAIADEHRLSTDGERPRGEVGALRVPARVYPEIHEELEAIREAIPETEVEIEGARPARSLAG